jgi:hypothetical protein
VLADFNGRFAKTAVADTENGLAWQQVKVEQSLTTIAIAQMREAGIWKPTASCPSAFCWLWIMADGSPWQLTLFHRFIQADQLLLFPS